MLHSQKVNGRYRNTHHVLYMSYYRADKFARHNLCEEFLSAKLTTPRLILRLPTNACIQTMQQCATEENAFRNETRFKPVRRFSGNKCCATNPRQNSKHRQNVCIPVACMLAKIIKQK